MKGLIITTDNIIRIAEFSNPAHESIGKVVGGWIEIVHPKRLNAPYCMVVNEEGLWEHLLLNLYGSYLYGTDLHCNPIVGDIVILKEGWVNGERDFTGLSDDELVAFAEQIEAWSNGDVHREVQ